MNDTQNAKLNMAQGVSDMLASNAPVYQGMPLMVTAVADLKADIGSIREQVVDMKTVSVPVATQKKRAAEGKVFDASVKASAALYVVGFTKGDKELTSLLHVSPNTFYCMNGNAALALAQHILGLVKAHATELAGLGYTPETIADFEASVAEFQSLIVGPRETISARKTKTTNLKQLFASLDSTLYDRLDKLMVLFKTSHPDFYNEYRTARNLIITSVRHKKGATEEAKAEA
jgi:hypothetical protein